MQLDLLFIYDIGARGVQVYLDLLIIHNLGARGVQLYLDLSWPKEIQAIELDLLIS